jgi:hypothetical protein
MGRERERERRGAESNETFDEAYYERYYGSARTRVHSSDDVGKLCAAVVSLLEWWQQPPQTVLDVGAGIGLWRDWFKKHRPSVRYRSTEYSAHACRAYGHEQRDITQWRVKETFDLVVCQGVLPYLDDAGAAKAIENLAAMSAGFLYLEAITKRDIRDVCDGARTDVAVHGRSGSWYRSRLGKHYREVGCGLWCKKDAGVLFYELEAGGG